jgi:pimeloyl-ACP methyl ester carboxylesterase
VTSSALRLRAALLVPLYAGLLAGCSTIFAVDDQEKLVAKLAVIGGNVGPADHAAKGPFVVGLLAKGPSGYRLVDHFVTEKPGSWLVAVEPGTYWVVAFEDVQRDGRYNDEPALKLDESKPITLASGEKKLGLDVKVPLAGRFTITGFSPSELEARGQKEQQTVSVMALSVSGEVAPLSDPKFAPEIGAAGLWRTYDFLLQVRPGIYFLEPYDPKKIPVIFVHGAGGNPREFTYLIDSLDHSRYQAWVAYYPSGASLDALGRWMSQLYVRMRSTYGFERAAVVAHSMGGLVARYFLLYDHELSADDTIRTFVTISSPLGGMAAAAKGIDRSPVVLKAWYGLAPGGTFLDGLFYSDAPSDKIRRRLPASMQYHLLFSYRGGGSSGSSDGTVLVSSELRDEAQQEATSIRGFDEDHTSVLRSKAVATRLNEILAEMK